jgi:hypothetical protein
MEDSTITSMNLTVAEYTTILDALIRPPFAAEVGNAYAGTLQCFIAEHTDASFAFLKGLEPTNPHRMFIRALTENVLRQKRRVTAVEQ